MKKSVLIILVAVSAMIWLSACNSAKSNILTEKHQVQVQKKGEGMIYADEVPCKTVLQTEDSSGNTTFHCFRIGFIDSLVLAKAVDKKGLQEEKYFQYDVQNDWIALVNGDSSRPVFYQPRQKMENHRYEGILVFETPKEKMPDTLMYFDSRGAWGVQQLIFNNNKK